MITDEERKELGEAKEIVRKCANERIKEIESFEYVNIRRYYFNELKGLKKLLDILDDLY